MDGSTTAVLPTAGSESPTTARRVISMRDAVGYDTVQCSHEAPVADALSLKHDRLFLLTDRHGNIAPAGACALGLFRDDTRVLSRYELRVAGGQPIRLSSEIIAPFHARVDLAVSDRAFGGHARELKHAVHLRRDLVVGESFMERLTVTNYLTQPIDYWVELLVGCDFADIFEVRGWRRDQRGEYFEADVGDSSIGYGYRGRDGSLVESIVQFRQPPSVIAADKAIWSFMLEAGQSIALEWEIGAPREPRDDAAASPPPHVTIEDRRTQLGLEYELWRQECSRWHSDDEAFDATLHRATDDLKSLYVRADGAPVISAGVPWYSTVFGRDAIITSFETLPLNPRIARDTLRYLAARQGTRVDAYTEEQPGKIMHELRRGEMARSGEIPHVPYFGTIDATPLWITLLHETWRWTGDRALVEDLLPNVRRALDWMGHYGDIDGDGLIEYAQATERGLTNQGWKDSSDGVPYPDGRLPLAPIALVEVQAYAYDAKIRAAELFEQVGDMDTAIRLRIEAQALKSRVHEWFWVEELGTFALALDGDKRPIPTVTSNAGHALWARLPDPSHAQRVATTLFGRDMSCGWGIRTLSARHPTFNPMSYHNGSIWPHDNALIVQGLAHYGLTPQALPVVEAIRDAAAAVDFHRLPELYCGIDRSTATRPVLYPVSCSPQAWASGALFLMMQAVLGIMPDAPRGALRIRNPLLPGFLDELTVTNLTIGRSRVALHFARQAGRTLVNLLAVESEDEPIRVQIDLG